ncbi:MAG TPA: glutathione S-transferase family protein [Xanthobacteraceae bacterium]|nr:glutathione S-transferase family protein [Xanthobacteraceae bacterium]
MKLFSTPASHVTRKCVVTAMELGIRDRIELVPTVWPHNWATDTTEYDPDFLAANPAARCPALVTEGGITLSESTVICDYLNELGDFALCPRDGAERWQIMSLVAIATGGIMEAQGFRRAELLRKRENSEFKHEFSPRYVRKMMDRQDRCYGELDRRVADFSGKINLATIAIAVACASSDFRYPEDDWRLGAPRLGAWYDEYRHRPAMQATMQSETPTKG